MAKGLVQEQIQFLNLYIDALFVHNVAHKPTGEHDPKGEQQWAHVAPGRCNKNMVRDPTIQGASIDVYGKQRDHKELG